MLSSSRSFDGCAVQRACFALLHADARIAQRTRNGDRHFNRRLEHNVRSVVRAPDYPPSIADTLTQLEHSGRLVLMVTGNVTDFSGMRIHGLRTTTPITILRVID
jgi:hypothetical protein